jgi:hypothetical protein
VGDLWEDVGGMVALDSSKHNKSFYLVWVFCLLCSLKLLSLRGEVDVQLARAHVGI